MMGISASSNISGQTDLYMKFSIVHSVRQNFQRNCHFRNFYAIKVIFLTYYYYFYLNKKIPI